MFTLFYESGIEWFDTVANGAIWLIIVAVLAFVAWIGYDLVNGQRDDNYTIIQPETAMVTNLSGASRPFGRKAKTSKVPAHAELDS